MSEDVEMTCKFGMALPHAAPVLPCWYCEGKADGEPYDPKVHHGWSCEACDERRGLRDRIERMGAVIEAARSVDADKHAPECGIGRGAGSKSASYDDCWCALNVLTAALAALDAQINNTPRADNVRTCPNAVSWCEGPDRYAGICNTCLATWTEEAKEKPRV